MDMIFLPQTPPAAAPQTSQPPAGGGDAGASGGGGSTISFMIPLLLMFVVMYFLMIRPQRREAKKREQMIANVKKNDHVLTTGGIYGIVDRIKDNEVFLKIDEKNDVRIRVAKSAIVGVEKVSGAEGDAKPEAKEEAKKG